VHILLKLKIIGNTEKIEDENCWEYEKRKLI
jgi:hypothetical protein